jgi:hypothetical protein
MQDNFNIHSWQLKTAINELEKTNEDEIGLSDILARDLFKLQGKISDDLFYKLRKLVNSQDPAALAKAKEIISRIKPEDDRIYMGEEKGQCPECGCKMEAAMCNECGYMEEATFTDKHDDNPELKGGQKDLPDEVQAKIIAKEGENNPINILRDIYYFDKLNTLAAKEDIDPKYYSYGTLWAKKGDIFDSDSEEYDMILGSKDLEKGVDYTEGSINESEDHEVSMAQNSLKAIISSASQLMAKLGDNERDIPGWIQDHIAKSENYIEQANQSFHELEPYGDSDEMNEAMFTSANSNNPEGDKLVLRFLQGIAKKFDYPVYQAALFVKDRIKKLGY